MSYPALGVRQYRALVVPCVLYVYVCFPRPPRVTQEAQDPEPRVCIFHCMSEGQVGATRYSSKMFDQE